MQHKNTGSEGRMVQRVESLTQWFAGRQFPLAALSLLGSIVLLVGTLISIPESAGSLGSFAADFRRWCFGTDSKGQVQWISAILFFLDPVVLGGILFLIWRKPLREARAREVAAYGGVSLAIVLGIAGFFAWQSRSTSLAAFPAEQLRTAQAVPSFHLTDHTGRPAAITDHKGGVVLMTAFYTTCHNTCPLILNQVKRVVSELPEADRRDLTVMAITIDPDHDSVSKLAKAAKDQQLPDGTYRLLTGDKTAVHQLLSSLGIGWKKNPDTGVIEHANIMILVDRNGRIAYRFTLGETQERWLADGMRLLVKEKPLAQHL